MANTTQQPIQPERRDRIYDEISLVDLVKILVRRWKALATIFALVVIATLAYILLLPQRYQYVSLYNAAESAPAEALESPSSLVAKAHNLYLGPFTRQLIEEQGLQGLPFEVQVSNPSDTLLVKLSSNVSPEHAGKVMTLHKQVLGSLLEEQQELVERRRETLERQLDTNREALATVRDSNSFSAGELIATYTSRIASLEASLADLRNGKVGQTAIQSLEPVGISRSLVLALGVMIAGMLAVIGVLILQFASLVCASLKEESINDDP